MLSTDRPWENPTERIFPVVVNWASPYRQSFEFRTDIILADDGSEQRRSVRNEPRMTMEFDAAYQGGDMRDFGDFLNAYQPYDLVLPDPLDVGTAFIPMLPGSNTMRVVARKSWMTAGVEVILRAGRRMETRIIGSSEGGTLVTFNDSSGVSWPAGTRMHRTVRGRTAPVMSSAHLTNRALTVPVRFEVKIGGAPYVAAPVDPADIVGFREFWSKKPNWSGGVDVDYEFEREDVDYGFGRVTGYVPYKHASRAIKANYIGVSPADIHKVISFFIRHRGRRNEFLFCTGEDDIPYNAILGGSTLVSIAGQKFGRYYLDNPVFRRLIFRMSNDDLVHSLIDQIQINEEFDTTAINLVDPLPNRVFSPQTMFGVSWGIVCRMGSDKLDIDWLTDEKAQFSLSFKSLENDE